MITFSRLQLRESRWPSRRVRVATGASGLIGNAAAVLDAVAPELSKADRQKVLAIAYFESGFGTTLGCANNWGAITGSGDDGSCEHPDSNADGTVYMSTFARYSTPQAGAKRLVQVLRYYGALDRGSSAWSTARAMFVHPTNGPDHGYYSGRRHRGTKKGTAQDYYERVLDYAKAIKRNADIVASALGEPKYVALDDPGSWDGSGVAFGQFVVGTAAIAALWYYGFGPGRLQFYRWIGV